MLVTLVPSLLLTFKVCRAHLLWSQHAPAFGVCRQHIPFPPSCFPRSAFAELTTLFLLLGFESTALTSLVPSLAPLPRGLRDLPPWPRLPLLVP